MNRKRKIQCSSAGHQVMNRGARRKKTSTIIERKSSFLALFDFICERWQISTLDYCLTDNSACLFLEKLHESLGQVLRVIIRRNAQYFNHPANTDRLISADNTGCTIAKMTKRVERFIEKQEKLGKYIPTVKRRMH